MEFIRSQALDIEQKEAIRRLKHVVQQQGFRTANQGRRQRRVGGVEYEPTRAEAVEPELDASNAAERRTLKWVLGINSTQVVVAGAVGLAVESTGLLGAALDNLGDAAVYVVSLYAVGRTVPPRLAPRGRSGLGRAGVNRRPLSSTMKGSSHANSR